MLLTGGQISMAISSFVGKPPTHLIDSRYVLILLLSIHIYIPTVSFGICTPATDFTEYTGSYKASYAIISTSSKYGPNSGRRQTLW